MAFAYFNALIFASRPAIATRPMAIASCSLGVAAAAAGSDTLIKAIPSVDVPTATLAATA
jgi:hypothetical protein